MSRISRSHPNQARDKEVIAYFQQAVQPKDRLPKSKCPNCPKSEKKALDGRAQPKSWGWASKKKYPAVKIHPGKFERGPQNFFPTGYYNSRNFGKFFPHFGPEIGLQLPRKNYPAVKIHAGKFENGPQKFLPLAGRLGSLTQSASHEIGHRQHGGLISTSEE